MRKIKIRAWDKELETYLNPEYFYITGEGRGFTCEHLKGMYSDRYEYMGADRFILEQFTGLLDKNGKEIYEGDIVEFQAKDGSDWTMPFEIGFKDGRFAVVNIAPAKSLFKAMKDYCFSDEVFGSNMKIIGHIHKKGD
jgi:uncharacterized phage protein (TIGR01671 family)